MGAPSEEVKDLIFETFSPTFVTCLHLSSLAHFFLIISLIRGIEE